ncbi:unnamed protein product [Chondrus crispus]|uniref:Uncharacterized protein n=1 Tax=Chondrus crispus TaxID=2769 RepID=R7QHZ8_CHOCR|nr:unnamed protein product [Chondrus crispus]CDF38142.1 unnamed protein product [Chondrus crispus]|eukprot:XP_005718011.1 unnamed protein product [Chondrus crispus]
MTSVLMMGFSSAGGLSPSLERREATGVVDLSIAGEGGGLGSGMAADRDSGRSPDACEDGFW